MLGAILGAIGSVFGAVQGQESNKVSSDINQQLLEIAKMQSDIGVDFYQSQLPMRNATENALMDAIKNPQPYMQSMASGQVSSINEDFIGAKNDLNQNMAARGLLGSGIQAQAMGDLAGTRGAAIGQAKSEASRLPWELSHAFTALGRGLPDTAASGLGQAAAGLYNIGQGNMANASRQSQLLSDATGFGAGMYELSK